MNYTEPSELDKPEINECIRAIADQVVKSASIENQAISVNPKTNEIFYDPESIFITADKQIYANNLPPNITLEQIQAVKQYNDNFTAGVLLGTAKVALEEMKKRPEVKCATSGVLREDYNTFVNVYVGIHADEDGAPNESELFSFGAQVKTMGFLPATELMKVRKHLNQLYIEALCEPKSIKVKDES